MNDSDLPAGFEPLTPFVSYWARDTTEQRLKARCEAAMEQTQAFYDAMLPLLERAVLCIDESPLHALPADKALLAKTSAEWVEILNAAGVPCGPIYTMDQVFADPQVKHLGVSTPVVHPKLGKLHLLGQAVKLSRTPAAIAAASPERGEHSEEVLREAGYSAAEIDQFKTKGII